MRKHMRPISMTMHGEVLDLDGDMPTENNLGYVLLDLSSKRKIRRSTKIIVNVSRIDDTVIDHPTRCKEKRIYSYGYLLRCWKEWQGQDFEPISFLEKMSFLREALHKQGEKRAAWTPYVMRKQIERAQERERKYHQDLSECKTDEDKEALKEKRRKETSGAQLYIG